MRAIRQTVRVLPGGRIEITDAALVAGVEADVVVIVPEPTGDGAAAVPAPPTLPSLRSGRTFEEMEALPPLPLDQVVGSAPSGRSAEEIDRDLREMRDEWDGSPGLGAGRPTSTRTCSSTPSRT